MREYETIYVLRPNTPEKAATEFVERLTKLIESNKGKVLINRSWGKRHLAYLIAKEKEGIYIHLDYTGDQTLVLELEKLLRYDENVIRFLTVLLHDNVDVEKRLEEIAKADALAEQNAAAAPAPAVHA